MDHKAIPTTTNLEKTSRPGWRHTARGVILGFVLVSATVAVPPLRNTAWQSVGPILGIALVICSLFGDLPPRIAWLQRLGDLLLPGVALGTIVLLFPLLLPTSTRESSVLAFSPFVWVAYLSIVLVSISFEESGLPEVIYQWCRSSAMKPTVFVPVYVVVAGLLGNILDGVSIISISAVIFMRLLPRTWGIRASFALLFGGLISNLITVAAEPTNIKFEDVLHPLLDRVVPSYWATNWPISLLGILFPALWLAVWMNAAQVTWHLAGTERSDSDKALNTSVQSFLSGTAVILLAIGIVAHSVLQAYLAGSVPFREPPPLGIFLLPAAGMAVLHLRNATRQLDAKNLVEVRVRFQNRLLFTRSTHPTTWRRLLYEGPIWARLMTVFSLLWLVTNTLPRSTSALASFFSLPVQLRFALMLLLSLLSSVTDNVAVAALQGSLLLHHSLMIWQIRLLFVGLAWSGGFTPFGCLQSLALNSRLKLSTGIWLRETPVWGFVSVCGGIAGLVFVGILYPSTVNLPR